MILAKHDGNSPFVPCPALFSVMETVESYSGQAVEEYHTYFSLVCWMEKCSQNLCAEHCLPVFCTPVIMHKTTKAAGFCYLALDCEVEKYSY